MHFRSAIDQAGAEPEGYNLLYLFLLKKFFCVTYVKNIAVKLHVSR